MKWAFDVMGSACASLRTVIKHYKLKDRRAQHFTPPVRDV